MAVAHSVRNHIREQPVALTVILSILGYGLVVGTFAGVLDIYPTLSESQVDILTHLIAVINSITLVCLFAGVYYIMNNEYKKHGIAMFSSFMLILAFLVVYMIRVGGGETKALVGAPVLVEYAYLIMLAIHIILSIVSVPVVLYVVLLGISHSPSELATTMKARVGRIAAGAWILSLVLGIVTYLILNHIYENEPLGSLLLLALVAPVSWRETIKAIQNALDW